mmetsp:Transcript_21937/g.53403  ORF Transcript_21937/g.53403 Transcript_21937/m.53403 type:complete len:211 (+) Transcript_21937:543-1175(+)
MSRHTSQSVDSYSINENISGDGIKEHCTSGRIHRSESWGLTCADESSTQASCYKLNSKATSIPREKRSWCGELNKERAASVDVTARCKNLPHPSLTCSDVRKIERFKCNYDGITSLGQRQLRRSFANLPQNCSTAEILAANAHPAIKDHTSSARLLHSLPLVLRNGQLTQSHWSPRCPPAFTRFRRYRHPHDFVVVVHLGHCTGPAYRNL